MDGSLNFSGHQSFPFRNTWLTKGVTDCFADPELFTKDDAMVTLGVGKNMVQSIRHWCLATQMLQEDGTKNNRGRRLTTTDLGAKIFLEDGGWDPYLEDTATLWLLHWLLVTNTHRATTWRYAFNSLHQPEFTRANLERALANHAQHTQGLQVPADTLRRDVEVFIRTYVGSTAPSRQLFEDSLDCPLVELGLIIEQEARSSYAFMRGPKDSLPDAVLIYALWDYISQRKEQSSFSFDELAYGPLSPGQAFKLDESSLAERFDRIATLTDGAWQFNETAGYRQLLIQRPVKGIDCLATYYGEAAIPASGGAFS